MSYDVRLGRLQIPTVLEGLKETVGEQLDNVGAISLPGERQPKQMPLTLPIYGGPGDDDPRETGLRIRRQLRALLRNPKARGDGLYFNWAADPELNAWLLVGRGEIVDGDGGITFADFKAELSDVVIAGAPRTHRLGRRLEAIDRRVPTTARDYRGTIFSTDFAAQTAEVRHYLPVGPTDILGAGNRLIAPSGTRLSDEGQVPYVVGATPGEPVTFEQEETDLHKGDVVIRDRGGPGELIAPPAFNPYSLAPIFALEPDEFGLEPDDPLATAIDTSGNERDFLQATGGDRPTVRGGADLLNGHLVVEHDGAGDSVALPGSGALGAPASGHIFMVRKIDADPPASGAQGGLWDLGHFASRTYVPYSDGLIYEMFGTTVRKEGIDPDTDLTQWHIYEVRSADNDYEIKIDGVSKFQTSSNVVYLDSGIIGKSGDGAANLDGKWAACWMFPALTDSDADDVRGFLQERFAL